MNKFAVSVLAIISSTACGTAAIVETRDGGYYEGRITGHDNGHVYIQGKVVDQEEISDIDHPGNVAAIIGGIVAGIGALGATHNCSKDTRAVEGDGPCSGSGVWLLTGIPVMIYGIVTHSESVSRAGQ